MMKTKLAVFIVIIAFVGVFCLNVFTNAAEDTAQAGGGETAGTEEAKSNVVVKVNGETITEDQVEKNIMRILSQQQTQLQPEQMEQFKKFYRTQIIEMLVNNELMIQMAKKENVKVTDKDYMEILDEQLEQFRSMQGWSEEELVENLKSAPGFTNMEDFKKQQVENIKKDDGARAAILQGKLLERKFPEKLKVTETAIEEHYEKNKESQFTQNAQVRASHILCSILDEQRQPKSEEEQKAAFEKCEKIKQDLAKPDVDFAEVAKDHSDCPSSSNGGDLNFFAKDRMVPEFSEAAFNMEVGEVSDIVKTQFGYHIIKVTDKKDGKVIPFKEAHDMIKMQLHNENLAKAREEYLDEVKKDAEIEYVNQNDAPGKQPAGLPVPAPAKKES